jgi:hypothetical protein
MVKRVLSLGAAVLALATAGTACFSLGDLAAFPCANDGTCPSGMIMSKSFYCSADRTCRPCDSNMSCVAVGDTAVSCDPRSGCGTQGCYLDFPAATICSDAGTGREGDPCEPYGAAACAVGYQCVGYSTGTCQQLCDLGDSASASGSLQCPRGQRCQAIVEPGGWEAVNGILYGVCGACNGGECAPPNPQDAGCAEDDGGMPAGSYSATCTGCSSTSTELTCSACYDSIGMTHAASLLLPCCVGVGNCEGVLVCGPC